jgi:hypothetical protein
VAQTISRRRGSSSFRGRGSETARGFDFSGDSSGNSRNAGLLWSIILVTWELTGLHIGHCGLKVISVDRLGKGRTKLLLARRGRTQEGGSER